MCVRFILGEQTGDSVKQFYEALGVSPDDVSETSNVDDSDSDVSANRSVKLYKISCEFDS